GIAALLMWWMRSLDVPPTLRIVSLVVLGASSSFAGFALQFRVDVLANLLLLGGLTLIAQQRLWIPAGALLAAAVLANVRLAPLVVIVTIAALFLPRWNVRVLLTL